MTDSQKNPSNDVLIPSAPNSTPLFPLQSSALLPVNTGQIQEFSAVQSDVRDVNGRFVKGSSPNPAGRPRGARNKFTDTFMSAIAEDFAANGSSALAALRTSNPEAYMRIIIALLPKAAVERWEQSRGIDYDNVTEEEFIALLDKLQREKIMQQAVEMVSK